MLICLYLSFPSLGSNLDFFLKLLRLFSLLSKLSIDFFKHLLLDHATEGILHGVTSGFECTQAGALLCSIFFMLSLDLGLEKDLDEAL